MSSHFTRQIKDNIVSAPPPPPPHAFFSADAHDLDQNK